LGTPVTLIGEAVFARCLSALKDERVQASKILQGFNVTGFTGDREAFIEDIRQAVYAAKIISYAQGFMELREAAKEHGWDLNYGAIALMWRGGCIIRRYQSILNLTVSAFSWVKSPKRTRPIRRFRIFFWILSSPKLFIVVFLVLDGSSVKQLCSGFPFHAFHQRSAFTMVTVLRSSQPLFYKHKYVFNY
jgi:hypothetical protein